MTAEDRLRDLLRSEATTIVPAGDGLARIRERVARRRRARFWVFPSAAVATAAAVAAFVLIAPDDHKTQTLQPASPTATTEPSGSPAPVVPDDGGMPLDVPAIWPFTTQQEAAGWASRYPYAENGLDVGRHFVADHLGLTGVEVSQTCVSCAVLQLKAGATSVGEITLARVGVGFASGHGTQVYTVVGVGGTDLTVTSPAAGTAITSPTGVTGRITGVHENVQLRLLTSSGDELATTGAPAGGEVPWSATMSWTRSDWTHGSVVGVTRSDKDGSVTRVVAVPVTRSTASPTASFVGRVDGHISLFDASTGKVLRRLTYPPAGATDSSPAWSHGTLLWVRIRSGATCGYELDRLDGNTASTVVRSGTVSISTPQLSPSGAWQAWVEVACAGSANRVVVSGGGAPARRLSVPAGTNAVLRDVRDDGALVLWLMSSGQSTGTLLVVPPGALDLTGAHQLTAVSGCEIGAAGSWDGQQVVVFETCLDGTGRLVRFSDTGRRLGADKAVRNLEPPDQLSVRDGAVLVWLFGGDTYGEIARYHDGAFTTVVANTGCTSISSTKGCVAEPDW
jgi:hypothetical protein